MTATLSSTGSGPPLWHFPAVTPPGAEPEVEPHRPVVRWPWALTALSLFAYVASAAWMIYGLRYEIGDAVSRTADARAMLFSRDPHLAAMGFVWLPLPVFAELPSMLVLSPLHQAIFAGPLSTAIGGAMTVFVVAQICRTLGLARWTSIALTAAFAFNPVVVFTAANGMSEEWFWFGVALAFLGLFRWRATHRSLDLAMLSTGCAIGMVVRYEAALFAPIMAFLAVVGDRSSSGWGSDHIGLRARRAGTVAATVVLPALYLLILWLVAEKVIQRSAFFWLKAQQNTGATPTIHPWLPAILTTTTITAWAVGHAISITPGAALFAPFLLIRRRLADVLTGAGLLVGCWFFPALTIVLLLKRSSSGDPRYLEPEILFVTITAAWLMASVMPRSQLARLAFNLGLLGVLGVGALSAMQTLSNPNLAYIEQVDRFYLGIQGRPVPRITAQEATPVVGAWKPIADNIDTYLGHGGRVLIDDNVAFPLFVLTRYPTHYFVSSDRDYESTLSDPTGRFNYLVLVPGSPLAPQFQAILASPAVGQWVMIRKYLDPSTHSELCELYKLDVTGRGSAGSQAGSPSTR